MRNGMTLMSVMVAVALAGVVALAVARLLGNQTKAMTVIRLREQRENLLKHYKNIVVSGWDATRESCGGAVCTRQRGVIIPGGGLYLADDLYDYNYTGGTAERWWHVTTERVDLSSGDILQADSYAAAEDMVAMRVKVDFRRKEHPLINLRLASREEIVFLHHNTSSALDSNSTQCEGGHRTQIDADGSALYAGAGALTQYDFKSNYSKCSQVPLVINDTLCDNPFEALLGFFREDGTETLPLRKQLVTGSGICSIRDKDSDRAEIRGKTEKRTVVAKDCRRQGYIQVIGVDEVPGCVSSANDPCPGLMKRASDGIWVEAVMDDDSGNCRAKEPDEVDDVVRDNQRVAARSVGCKRDCDCFYKAFTLKTRIDKGIDAAPAQYEIRYASDSNHCTVLRRKGVHSYVGFTTWSGVRHALVDFEDSHGAGQGPPGPRGELGEKNGPTGPPGPRGLSCRRPCPTPTP